MGRVATTSLQKKAVLHRKGLAITAIGGFMMTFDAPLLRLVGTDPMTAIFWRGLFMFTAMLVFWLWLRYATGRRIAFINGRDGIIVGFMHALASIQFMVALHNTTVANLVFILALVPLFTALFSFFWLRERIDLPTRLAILMGIIGVGIIVMDGLAQGSLLGDSLALGCAVTLGMGLTFVRRSGKDLSLSPALGALIAAIAALPFAEQLWLTGHQWTFMMLNGLIVVPMASALLVTGPRFIPAPEVAMFFLLETVLAPVWVWLLIGEVPTRNSVLGGVVILSALILHSLYKLFKGRTQNGLPPPQIP